MNFLTRGLEKLKSAGGINYILSLKILNQQIKTLDLILK